jgi:hypothetical protein
MLYINQKDNSISEYTKEFQGHKFIYISCIEKVQVDFIKVSDEE